jgi:transcriptional regulator with XRE-family HTH domain
MSNDTLNRFRLKVKPPAAYGHLGHLSPMRKQVDEKKITSELQATFVRRLNEEMELGGISDNQLAALCAKANLPVGQSSISRITKGRQDPTLTVVYRLAKGLGISPLALLVDGHQIGQRITRYDIAVQQKVARLPTPYPKIFTSLQGNVQVSRRKRRKRV